MIRLLLIITSLIIILPLSACNTIEPVTATKIAPNVKLLLLNDYLNEHLRVNQAKLVFGHRLKQLQILVQNTSSKKLTIFSEPQWYDKRGLMMQSEYSQRQTHYLSAGEAISLTHKAFNINASTVRIEIGCLETGCYQKK